MLYDYILHKTNGLNLVTVNLFDVSTLIKFFFRLASTIFILLYNRHAFIVLIFIRVVPDTRIRPDFDEKPDIRLSGIKTGYPESGLLKSGRIRILA